ncbi:MAG: nuclear transport factor 2 family protein [Acidobacteriota bacterium]|nr:nuclear transport factor 2 family protein [Acidobacteriota bacterium]
MRARRVSFVVHTTGACLLFAAASASAAVGAEDPAVIIRRLNQDYVTAFLKSDVERYRQLLADDFAAILSNGNLVDRATFLEAAAQPAKVGFFELLDVEVRVSGSFAVVRARTSFRRPDGSPGQNRYSNVYALRNGRWVVVWGQVTPVAGAAPNR